MLSKVLKTFILKIVHPPYLDLLRRECMYNKKDKKIEKK